MSEPATAAAERTTAERTTDGQVILVTAFGTTAVQWAVAYLGRLPREVAEDHIVPILSSPTLAVLLLLGMAGGGLLAGRWARRPLRAGLLAGVLSALLNLLIVLSAVSRDAGVERSGLEWLETVTGFLLVGAMVGGSGGLLGGKFTQPLNAREGPRRMTQVAFLATFLLVILGGVVTSAGAGLAVEDWPTTFGTNMFLFPLSKMVGGVYYEHAHRLYGALVGLTTLATGSLLIFGDRRRRLTGWAVMAMLLVIVQGVLGGVRVRLADGGGVDTSTAQLLAVVHGVMGQLFLALMAALVAWTSRTWWTLPGRGGAVVRKDRRLALVLVGMVVIQLVLGALLRQYGRPHLDHDGRPGLIPHMMWAFLIIGHAFVVAARSHSFHGEHRWVARTGIFIAALFATQLALGFAAMMITNTESREGLALVLVPTVHQAVGALILATVIIQWQWLRRLDGAID